LNLDAFVLAEVYGFWLMELSLMRQFLEVLRGLQRIMVPSGNNTMKSEKYSLGLG
jgi:hypothetical protein